MVTFCVNPSLQAAPRGVPAGAQRLVGGCQDTDARIPEARGMAPSDASSLAQHSHICGTPAPTGIEPALGLDRTVGAVRRVFARYPDWLLADSALGRFRDLLEQQVLEAVALAHGHGANVGAPLPPPPPSPELPRRPVAAGLPEATGPLAPGSHRAPSPTSSFIAADVTVETPAERAAAAAETRATDVLEDASCGAGAGEGAVPVPHRAAVALPAAASQALNAAMAPPPPTAYPHAADAADALAMRWQALLAQEQEAADANLSVPLASGVTRARRYPTRCRTAA